MEVVRRQSREDTLATLLAAGLYPEGAAMARRMGFGEEHVHDLVERAADISDDDDFMVFESVWGLESRLDLV
jgi:hypothetical protein